MAKVPTYLPHPSGAQGQQVKEAANRTASKGRMLGIDVLRALAILGMVWLHFSLTGWGNPAPAGQPADATLTWIGDLLSSRSREVFFFLAGVTVALLTGGMNVRRGRERAIAWKRLTVRSGMLFLLALVLGELGVWDMQILHYYALWLLLLLPLSLLRVRTLLISVGVLAVACPVFKIAADHAGSSWGFIRGMDPSTPPQLLHGGFSLLVHPGEWLAQIQEVIFGLGNMGQDTISVLPFLVLGLALGKLDLRDAPVRRRLTLAGAGTAVAALMLSLVSMYPLGAADAVNAYKNPPTAASASQVPDSD
ncbi:heparan-alpha-glucosaminide N-acetyltransferase domain-containing protein, partial [Streptomyces virginiae]